MFNQIFFSKNNNNNKKQGCLVFCVHALFVARQDLFVLLLHNYNQMIESNPVIKGKLLLSSYKQLCAVQYGEIGR